MEGGAPSPPIRLCVAADVRKLGDLNWGPYATTVFQIKGSYPTSREMITPVDLSNAPQLDEVFRVDL